MGNFIRYKRLCIKWGLNDAIRGRHYKVLEWLLCQKKFNSFGPALDGACFIGDKRLMNRIFELGEKQDAKNGFLGACEAGNKEIAKMMISKVPKNDHHVMLNCVFTEHVWEGIWILPNG